jgi:type II secretory pathway predicted ATPase ExeA
MFEPHFGLRENPFSTGHDSRFVYPSPEHLEAVAHFRYGIQNREAFVLVTGEVGTGKTTAIYDLVSRLPQTTHVALINNSALTRLELLEEIARRFGVEPPGQPSKPALLASLEHRLALHVGHGEPCILIVDEAQNLSHELLEEVRLLSNLEDRGGRLLHICLVGQPELEEKLARPELRQLRQRISVKYRLNPLSAEEATRYIHHRLRVAGGEPDRIFPADSCDAVHRLTHGIPREINIVASQSMVNAYLAGMRPVRPEHVRSVSEDFSFKSVLGGSGPIPPPPPLPGQIPVAPAAGALAGRPPVAPVPAAAPPPPPMLARPTAPPPPPPYTMPQPYFAPPSPPPIAPAPPPPAVAAPPPAAAPSAWGARPLSPVAPAHAAPHAPVEPIAPLPAPGAVPVDPAAAFTPILPSAPLPAAPVAPVPAQTAPAAASAPAPAPPPPAGAPVASAPRRTVSNWRERRSPPMPTPAAAVTPATHASDADALAYAAADQGEDLRARRTRLIALAAVVAVVAIGGMVVYSTGLFGLGAKRDGDVQAHGGAVPAPDGATPARVDSSTAAVPDAATTIAPGTPVYGLQVASFKTAGRATRVLNDYMETTGLPGEIMASEFDGDTWYRIVLGRFAGESEARAASEELLGRSLIAEGIVVPYTPQQR